MISGDGKASGNACNILNDDMPPRRFECSAAGEDREGVGMEIGLKKGLERMKRWRGYSCYRNDGIRF